VKEGNWPWTIRVGNTLAKAGIRGDLATWGNPGIILGGSVGKGAQGNSDEG